MTWSESDVGARSLLFGESVSHLAIPGMIPSFKVVCFHTSWSLKASCLSSGAQIRTQYYVLDLEEL